MRLYFDTETRSLLDVKTHGLDLYANHPSTQVTCANVRADDGWHGTAFYIQPEECDAAFVERVAYLMKAHGLNWVTPDHIAGAINNADTVVIHNAAFDVTIAAKKMGIHIPREKVSCTMARAARHGLPMALDNLATVLKLPAAKDKEGNRLTKQMMKPRPTWKKHGRGPMWFEDAERLVRQAAYNMQDNVVSECADKVLPELDARERAIWLHTWDVNETGIPLDLDFVNGAIKIHETEIRELTQAIYNFTGGAVDSLKAPEQIVAWVARFGLTMPSCDAEDVANSLAWPGLPYECRVVLEARQKAAHASVAKLPKALIQVSNDGRLRNQVVYYGTSTGRPAGRAVQVLNLPRPKLFENSSKSTTSKEVKTALKELRAFTIEAIRVGDIAAIRHAVSHAAQLEAQRETDTSKRLPYNIGAMLGDNVRSAFVADAKLDESKTQISADLSAIEARGVFWISDCQKALDAYRRKEDLYCQLASELHGRTITKADQEERQDGKVGILGGGYGIGPGKLAMQYGLPDDKAKKIVYTYRDTYPEVPAAWYDLGNAAENACMFPGTVFSACNNRVHFVVLNNCLHMALPSGRILYMPDAGYIDGQLYYHQWIKGGWRRVDIWGGVLMNYAIQGGMRDLMYQAELQIAARPEYQIILQCYDSLTSIVDALRADALLDEKIRIMTTTPEWAPGLPLAAEGKIGMRYA